jgi:hypothetical protein
VCVRRESEGLTGSAVEEVMARTLPQLMTTPSLLLLVYGPLHASLLQAYL